MWCLNTIVQVNEVASELITQGRSERGAYNICGIGCIDNKRLVEEFEKSKREPLKVAS